VCPTEQTDNTAGEAIASDAPWHQRASVKTERPHHEKRHSRGRQFDPDRPLTREMLLSALAPGTFMNDI